MATETRSSRQPADPAPPTGAGWAVSRHASVILGALLVITLSLMWPLITMPPSSLASQTPITRVTEAQELIDSRFEPIEHDVLFVVEATDGNMLTADALAELHSAIEAVRTKSEVSEFLVTVEAPELGLEELGTITIADAVDALLVDSGIEGGLYAAPAATIDRVVSGIIDSTGPEVWGLASQTMVHDGIWKSPAMFVTIAADNAALGGGGRVVTVGTDDTRREQYARELRSTIEEESETFDAWTVAADVNLTAEDQGQAAGPYIAATVAAVLLVLGVAFRSYWPVAVAGLALGSLMVWIRGGANLAGFEEDQILATILPIAMVSFGIDSTFHALGRVRESPHHGSSRRAFGIGFSAVAAALVLAASTDAAAFLANATSSIESIRQFGIAAAGSTVAAFLLLGVATPLLVTAIEDRTGRATLTVGPSQDLLPSLGAALGATAVVMVMVFLSPAVGVGLLITYGIVAVAFPALRAKSDGPSIVGETRHGSSSNRLGSWIRSVAARPRMTLTVAGVVTLVAGWASLGLHTNFEVSEFFDPESDFLVGIDKAQQYIGTRAGEPILVFVDGPLANSDALGDVTTFISDVDQVDTASLARNPDGTIKAAAPLLDLAESAGAVDLASLYTRALEQGAGQLSPEEVGEFLWHEPRTERYSTIISLEIPDTRQQDPVHEVRVELDELVADLEANLQQLDPAAQAVLAGSPIVRDDQLDGIASSLLSTLPVAAIACFVLAAAFMRSWRYGFVTTLPIVMVLIWLFGFMAATDRSINAVTAIVGAISIGIGIDYATHFTIRFLEEHRRARDKLTAVQLAGAGTGGALAGSAGTSVAGFAILALAPMPLFASYGVLTVVMIVMALVASLLVLPAILVLTTGESAAPANAIFDPGELGESPDAPAGVGERPHVTLEIGTGGTWVEAIADVNGAVHRRRGAATQEGIVEAMVAAVTAGGTDPPPFPVSISRTSAGDLDLLVLVLEHPGGTLTSGVAPIGRSLTGTLEDAVLAALGWPAPLRRATLDGIRPAGFDL